MFSFLAVFISRTSVVQIKGNRMNDSFIRIQFIIASIKSLFLFTLCCIACILFEIRSNWAVSLDSLKSNCGPKIIFLFRRV